MLPLLVGSMNLPGEKIDVSGYHFHHEAGWTAGCPLHLLLPIGVTGLEGMQKDIAVVVDVISPTLVQRLLQVPSRFGDAIQAKQRAGCIVGRYIVPFSDL